MYIPYIAYMRGEHAFRPEISEGNYHKVQILIGKPIRNFNNALSVLLEDYEKLEHLKKHQSKKI